jgi:hypothetical protein
MENTIPSIARGDCGAELCAYGKRFINFARAGFTRSCSTPGRRFVWVVAELAGHGNDASTGEKRAARKRASVNKISGKFV